MSRRRKSIDYVKLAGGDAPDGAGSQEVGGAVHRQDFGGIRRELLEQYHGGRSLSCATKPATSPAELLDLTQPVKYSMAGDSLFARPGAAMLVPEGLAKLLGPEAEVRVRLRLCAWRSSPAGDPASCR